ncbi:N-acetyltransferase [bacterium]|nr:N-acetyltransferase [bacterium]
MAEIVRRNTYQLSRYTWIVIVKFTDRGKESMDKAAVLAKYTRQMRQEITFPDMQKESMTHVVRFTRPAPGMSLVLFSDLDSSTADDEIEDQIAYFSANHLPFSWKVYGYDQPADLLSRLISYRFTPDPPDALMVLDLKTAPPILTSPHMVDMLQTDVAHLDDVVKIMEQVWGGSFNWIYDRLGSHLAIDGYLSIYTVYANDQPACTGWTYFHPGSEFASLWGGSTIPSQRGKGLYTALLAARAKEALERGIKYLAVDAGEMSRPILDRYGFTKLTNIYACDYTGDGSTGLNILKTTT